MTSLPNMIEALERQQLSVTTSSTMVNVSKETIEEMMFAKGDSEEDIKTWAEESETLLSEADQCIRQITKELKDMEATTRQQYGQTSEVVGAYVRKILELPCIRERDVAKIHAFYETLLYNVESLQTLGSLNKLDAAVRFTFDKLEVMKSELAMTNDNWSDWTFPQFVEALEKWTKNNPVKENSEKYRKGRSFLANRNDSPSVGFKGCLYCSSDAHRAINCDKIIKPEDRKKILAEKHLCFNCAGAKHRAAECKSKGKCQVCQARHLVNLE